MTTRAAYTLIPILLALSIMLKFCKADSSMSEIQQEMEDAEPRLIWQDEFEKDGLPDPQIWSYDTGDGCGHSFGCGWGKNEWQYYTKSRKENARVEQGMLVIEAHKENWEDKEYTSARLVSRGKRDILYGRIEVRARVPEGKGTGVAIWLLSSDKKYGGWPESGEIDIMEYTGYEPDSVCSTAHSKSFNHLHGNQRAAKVNLPMSDNGFHTYTLEWSPEALRWYIDNTWYHTIEKTEDHPDQWPFDHPYHLIIHLAVGGNLGGEDGVDGSDWPRQLLIDYVRVYKI